MNFIFKQAVKVIPEKYKHDIIVQCMEDPTIKTIVTSAFCCLRVLYEDKPQASRQQIAKAEKLRKAYLQEIKKTIKKIPDLKNYSWLITDKYILTILEYGMNELQSSDMVVCEIEQNCKVKHLRRKIEETIATETVGFHTYYLKK